MVPRKKMNAGGGIGRSGGRSVRDSAIHNLHENRSRPRVYNHAFAQQLRKVARRAPTKPQRLRACRHFHGKRGVYLLSAVDIRLHSEEESISREPLWQKG